MLNIELVTKCLFQLLNYTFYFLLQDGDFSIGPHDMNFASGAGLVRFPEDGIVITPTTLKVRLFVTEHFFIDLLNIFSNH
jgi:hypothetical protein